MLDLGVKSCWFLLQCKVILPLQFAGALEERQIKIFPLSIAELK
jgi:hypothetical protein